MEYPGTKLTKPFRIFLLFFFIFLFCVLSPVIIMYTAGYRYDWQNGLLKETGAISIDIEPKDAVMLLNGIKITAKMPVRLNNIAPGKYNLRISADGYYDWVKDLEVKNKQTTYIKEIFLLKKNKPELIIDKKITGFAVSASGKYLTYTIASENGASEIWLWSAADNKSVFIEKIDSSSPQIKWSEISDYAAVADGRPPYAHLTIFNADDPYKQINLPGVVKNVPLKFEWSRLTGPLMFYSTKNDIRSFDASSGRDNLAIKNTYIDWAYDDNDVLWAVYTNTTTGEQVLAADVFGSGKITKLTGERQESEDILPVETKWNLLAVNKKTALLKNENQPEMTLISNDSRFNVSGENFKISRYNDWWLIWTKWEIWTFTEGEEPYLLNRSGENLQQVFPLDKYNTLALVWAGKTTALFPYYLVTHDIINNKISHAEADSENKILYFSGLISGKEGVWKLNY